MIHLVSIRTYTAECCANLATSTITSMSLRANLLRFCGGRAAPRFAIRSALRRRKTSWNMRIITWTLPVGADTKDQQPKAFFAGTGYVCRQRDHRNPPTDFVSGSVLGQAAAGTELLK